MLLQILQHTPLWVFVLFAVLVLLGAAQTRPRQLGRGRVALMPAIFLPLSLWGTWSLFGLQPAALGAWAAGVGTAVLVNRFARLPRGVRYIAETRSYAVSGSWFPLALMMTIFFLRYAVAVLTALQPALTAAPAFAAAAGLAYGLLSGTFLARALRILSAATP